MLDQRNQDTAELVTRYTIDIKAIVSRTAQNLVIIGEKLQAVKRLLPHGAWLDWLAHEFHWSERTARNLMSVASRFEPATVADLPIEIGALYVLSAKSTPAPAVDEALRLAKRGEVITQAKAKDLLKQHKTWGNERVIAPAITESASSKDDEPDASHAQDLQPVAMLDMNDVREEAADDEHGHEILGAMTLPIDAWDPITVEPEPEKAGAEGDPVEPEETVIEDTVEPSFPSVIEAPALILTSPAPAPVRRKRSTFNRTNETVDWAKWTWNPVTGCLHECVYCYARDLAQDLYPEKFAPTFRPERLSAPHHTRLPKEADDGIGWRNVFVCSMADLFGKWVRQDWIDAVLAEVRAAPQWNFLFLTKFPQRLVGIDWPRNAWVGTTVDEQYRVKIAEKAFRDIKASVKWLSCEPLRERLTFGSLEMFDWVVIGGQSASSGAPAFQPPSSWVEHLLFQARAAGCKVFCKENLHVWPREYPGQRPESLDLPMRRPAVERRSGGEEGALEVAGSGAHQAALDRGGARRGTEGRGASTPGEAPIGASMGRYEPEDGERMPRAGRAGETGSVALAESQQVSWRPTGGPDPGQASGDRLQTVPDQARALQAAGCSPKEIVARLNAGEGRRRYNLGAVLAMLRPMQDGAER